MRTNISKESQTGEIDLSEHSSYAVEIMIRYLYSHDYQKSRSCLVALPPEGILLGNAGVYALADQYLIDPLREAAKAEFTRQVDMWHSSEGFTHATRILWNHPEYCDLYNIIEDVVATNIEQLLANHGGAELVKEGMREGHLSLSMLRQVIRNRRR